MIVIPQADLISINTLPLPLMVPAASTTESGPAPRFDVALLEAAKAVKDGTPEGPTLNLAPKVQQSLESMLADLSQKPLDQLKSLAKQPDAVKPLVLQAAQDAGLNTEEQKTLQDVVSMALPQLVDLKTNFEAQRTMPADSTRVSEVIPGPQGGTPAMAASPADLLFAPETGPQPSPAALPIKEQAVKDPGNATLSALAASALAPVLISTRTDDGSGSQSALAAARQIEGPVAPAAPTPPTGRVIQVAVQAPVQNAPVAPVQAPAPTAKDEPATGEGAVPSARVEAPNTATNIPVPSQPNVQGAPAPRPSAPVNAQQVLNTIAPPASQAPAEASDPTAIADVPNTPTAPKSPAAPAKAEAPVQPGGNKALTAPADMEVQFLDPKAPVAVQEGSQVTLTADNQWILPQNTTAAPQGVTSAPQAAAPAAPAAVQVQAPMVPQASAQALAFQAVQPQAPVLQPTTSAQAPVIVQAPVSQPQGTVQAAVVAQAAVPVQTEPVAAVKDAPAAAEASAVNVSGEAVQAESAATVQARRSTDENAFGGLAQFGQDPVKTLAQQTAKDYAVKRAVFDQVTEALRTAPDTDSGKLLIRLKPANLGEVQVDLIMQGGKLSARIVASQGEVREAFLRDLPAFKAGLESQGISVKEVSVALRAGVQDQPQGQTQQQDQTWWRELPREEQALPLVVPGTPAYSNDSAANNDRFSALA